MMFKTMMFTLGITENSSIDVFRIVLAVWFFSVGYFLYKRANRLLLGLRPKAAVHIPAEVPCLTTRTYHTT